MLGNRTDCSEAKRAQLLAYFAWKLFNSCESFVAHILTAFTKIIDIFRHNYANRNPRWIRSWSESNCRASDSISLMASWRPMNLAHNLASCLPSAFRRFRSRNDILVHQSVHIAVNMRGIFIGMKMLSSITHSGGSLIRNSGLSKFGAGMILRICIAQ